MKAVIRRSTLLCQRGFSLIELATGLVISMAIAGTVVLLIQQQVSFFRVVNQFSFLRDDAPSINLLLGRIVQQADSYRIFSDKASAMSGAGAVNDDGDALWLRYRSPVGTHRQAIVAFEPVEGRLNFYNHSGDQWEATPTWTITSTPVDVTFSNQTGVLLISVTGPYGGEVTYVGTSE